MPRNILLMIADDLGRMAGCYGEPAIRTPNIDALAANGTRFDMAFTSTASCSASRSVIYTGLHTHETGQYGLNHDHHHFMTFDHVETAPAIFNRIGYRTGIIGKVHVGPEPVYPWAHREESGSRDVDWVATRAKNFFDSDAEIAFFLTVGFIDPHRDMTRAGFGDPGGPDPTFAPEDVSVPSFLPDLPEVREELANYYHSVARMDRGVGLILEALEATGQLDDTLICFLSDNGAPFLNSKTTLFDAGVHLPLIMRRPGQAPGIANPNIVSFVDILPTFVEWAQAEPSSSPRRGRSLLPILEAEHQREGWDRAFGSHTFHEVTNYWPTRFLRTPRYKYHRNVAWQLPFPFSGDLYGSISWEGIRNRAPVMIGARPLRDYVHRPAEELYDLWEDPAEVNNLAQDPAHAELVAKFRNELEAWQQDTSDPWFYRDGISVRAIEHHLGKGLSLPNRFDFDVDDPSS
ncbi:sulfatase [Thioclava sp. JE_KL1]|uniref:sulfatase family protein n=1 Tax=Thioclava sp. JE_KL1 TaxID=2651187 RepID=UPI00128D8F78|nr:sulfatase [Thioclava sp. JE_KL1]MPQ96095.1 sulfatase [Thioclava sp. JE_KL1]